MIILDQSTDAATTTPLFSATLRERGVYRIAHILITASAIVLVQGRLSARLPWHTIETFTSSDAKSVALFTHMRVVVTGNTGTVHVEIDM